MSRSRLGRAIVAAWESWSRSRGALSPSSLRTRSSRLRCSAPGTRSRCGGVLELEEKDVARLEAELREHPNDFPARLQVMAYYQRADRIGPERDRSKRVAHALWLIEHHPESEILHSPVSRFAPAS